MGQDIGFHRIIGKHPRGWLETKTAEDVPERFTERFDRRGNYTTLVFDVPHEYVKTCSCGEKCSYGCPGDAIYRPTDFDAFRGKLKEAGMWERREEEYNDGEKYDANQIFRDMTEWLETHPNVYIDFG